MPLQVPEITQRSVRPSFGTARVLTKVGTGLVKFRKTVSDHLPVWAVFGTVGLDDD